VNGRKRHIVVDTLGLVLAVVVHAASIQDRDGGRLVIERIATGFPRLRRIWADGGYAGQFVDWAQSMGKWVVEIVKRSDAAQGFEVLPRRWIVERTFAWLGRYRRMSKDYEMVTDSSEAMIRVAMINLMVHRLVPG
jgi:putative transposase